jgi:hypothetical protein
MFFPPLPACVQESAWPLHFPLHFPPKDPANGTNGLDRTRVGFRIPENNTFTSTEEQSQTEETRMMFQLAFSV